MRQERISRASAEQALAALEGQRITTAPTAPLLAVLSNTPLVTADERLANALAARFPVRWLGAL
jgi:hypothetical protein